MVSPSLTPTTLPDQAQAGQGSAKKKISADQTIEKPLFISSQLSRFKMHQYENQRANAVPLEAWSMEKATKH